MNKSVLARSILCLGLIVPLLLLSQPLLAQTSLPACTAEIADVDVDQTNDNDGADGIIDIDKDGDGLIEICDLEGLNEIRYQLDGSGYKTSSDATTITQGCPTAGCRGYELVKDLDFNADTSYRTTSNKVTWTASSGWVPIGSDSNRFSSIFEGNGHTIAHLYINRSSGEDIGLFAVTAATAQINNIKLSDANVTGNSDIGSLVGENYGSIISIDVIGTVNGVGAGGLVGENFGQISLCVANVMVTSISGDIGGLVGRHRNGVISESRASGAVIGQTNVGGLVGFNESRIVNTYAEGTVSGNGQVGGLVGSNSTNFGGRITNSYAIGQSVALIESDLVGGLVGLGINNSAVTASYWDTGKTKQESRGDFEAEFAKTKAELQSPTAPGTTPTEIYYGWSEDVWYFGSTNTYPLLRFTIDSDGDLVDDAIDIDDDNDGLIEVRNIDDLHEIRFQIDGSAKKQHANDQKNTSGCPSWGCMGYELVRSLDFNSAIDYRHGRINTDWTVADYSDDSDHGWHPLPAFGAVFNGNGYIIRNLQINRVSDQNVGLFAALNQQGRIENVELIYPNIRGGSNVGGLVGNNNGVVINSYVRDYDTDANTRDTTKYIEAISGSVGGLVGRNNGGGASIGHIINSGAVIDVQIKQDTSDDGINANAGGLAGFNLNGAEIINSYARGDVKGPCGVGGLTANNFSTTPLDPDKSSKIINSYATGDVITGFGNCNVAGNIRSGGLTAVNSGLISNSYTTSCFSSGSANVANTRRGGVVQDNSGTINNSYYQTTGCSGLQQTPSGSNKMQTQLQAPVATDSNFSSGIYQAWALSEWDFGDNSQYPVIRYTPGPDKDNPGCGYRGLPECVALLKNQLPVGRTVTYADTSVTVDMPDSISSTVTSEVNGAPATFTDDGAILVKSGDTVQVNAAGSFVIKDGINIPLDYSWHISSGPTLFPGELRGESISFNIGSQSGDAVLTLTLGDKYNTATALATKQIPIQILSRLAISSSFGEVIQDQVARLHRVVLASDQPQTVITAHSLNEAITLTVDDSAAKVTAVNGDGTSTASMITLQVDEGSKTEFTITETNSDSTAVTHTVRAFRRSGEVSLQKIEIADITFNKAISTPGSYVGMLPIGTTATESNQITFTAGETNAINMRTITVDEDGEGTSSTLGFTAVEDFAAPGTELTITLDDSVNLMAGSVMSITIQTSDAYIDETRASAMLADLPYNEGIYTIEIENAPVIIDDDDNGLIDIYTLDDLDEMRNQYANMPSTCGSNGDIKCEGFELRRSLDFNAADSYQDNTTNTKWTTGNGWDAIFGFNRVFEGNGYTIANLYIVNKEFALQGLFSELSVDGVIKNVGLLDAYVEGLSNVGSLVGTNRGSIINSYVTTATIIIGTLGGGSLVGRNVGSIINSYAMSATVTAYNRGGGLVGRNEGSIINSYVMTATVVSDLSSGGLVGSNEGSIISSFAYADVIGNGEVGGLVGLNEGGVIENAYAAGTVASTQTVVSAGGLVGQSTSDSEIRNSYAVSQVMPLTDGDSRVDGLVGDNDGSITASYWDKTVNADLTTSDNAKTTAELQNPTAPGAIPADTYYGWHTAAWDFGDSIHYPTLLYATTDSITVSECADNPTPSSALPRCGSRIPNQAIRNLIPDLPDLEVSEITIISQPAANDDGTINEGSTATITFEVSGGTGVYQYESTIDDDVSTSSTPLFMYSIADDFIATDATTQTVRVTIRVSDQSANIEDVEHTEELHILKTNNGSADINISITSATLTAIVGADPDGDPNPASYTYQWQSRAAGSTAQWMDIDDADDASYMITDDLAETSNEFRVQVMYIDGQKYQETPTSNAIRYTPPSELLPLMLSDIQLRLQPPANADGTINEGSTATLTFEVSGGTDDYQYASKIDDAEYTSFEPPFMYSISDDFIAADTTSQMVTLTIRVSDQSAEIEDFEYTEELHILKTNKGSADINLSITNTTLTTTIGTDPDGDPNPVSYTYQWQSRPLGEDSPWMTIAGADDTSYTISGDLASASGEFRVQVTYTDGQGYPETPISNVIRYIPPSELQPLMVSDIQLSFQPSANADGTINEGSTTTITFDVSGGTDDYQYASKIDNAEYTSFQLPFIYSIADDFIAADTTSQIVTLTIRVRDQSAEIEDVEHTEELHIRKTNNGPANITITEMNGTLSATVSADPDGDPNPASYTYQWQTRTGSEWMNIEGADDTSYTITTDGEFRVQVTYTDGQGYSETPTSNAIPYTRPDSSGLRIRTKVFLEGPLR